MLSRKLTHEGVVSLRLFLLRIVSLVDKLESVGIEVASHEAAELLSERKILLVPVLDSVDGCHVPHDGVHPRGDGIRTRSVGKQLLKVEDTVGDIVDVMHFDSNVGSPDKSCWL